MFLSPAIHAHISSPSFIEISGGFTNLPRQLYLKQQMFPLLLKQSLSQEFPCICKFFMVNNNADNNNVDNFESNDNKNNKPI